MPIKTSPLDSLAHGQWCKLIAGASFQDLPQISNLALAYTLAGVDCIDVAADVAVITAAQEGIDAALQMSSRLTRPILMVSLNAGADPHFRKASFNPQACPVNCSRPCVSICPAEAIKFNPTQTGVIPERCYGCGRCLPVCPLGHILTQAHPANPQIITPLVKSGIVRGLEIHTRPGDKKAWQDLWQQIQDWLPYLQVLAISCPDGEDLLAYLAWIKTYISPLPCALIWQTDGRPMSGDIGTGATRACVKLAEKVLAAKLGGYVQVAGGTNGHTVAKLRAMGLLRSPVVTSVTANTVAGIAYGSYARSLLASFQAHGENWLLDTSQLQSAVTVATALVSQIKASSPTHPWLNLPPDSDRLLTISNNS